MHDMNLVRNLKKVCAYGLHMQEVYNYALYDEQFLKQLQWEPSDTISVQRPVSENWQRLVTSLIPHLIKNVVQNSVGHDKLRFFEWGRYWKLKDSACIEKKSLSAIIFDRKQPVDFYDIKQELQPLWDSLQIKPVWKQIGKEAQPRFAPYEISIFNVGRYDYGDGWKDQ